MLAQSPRVLSLFEFFNGLDMTQRFGREPISGPCFAKLISQEHPFVTMVLRRGYPVPEIVYPFDAPGSRYSRRDPLPYLLGCALPRISDDPDALFDESLRFAESLPLQPPAAHYRQLFDWWTEELGREVWLERSGSSLDYLGTLFELFPEARFVHLHRDGREAALSMREHHAFRLAIAMTSQVLDDSIPSLADLGGLDPGGGHHDENQAADDPISQMLASRLDAEHCGRFWSQQVERGMAAREQLPEDRYLEVRFEELLADPREALERIGDFFALDSDSDSDDSYSSDSDREGWVERAGALVRGTPAARRKDLPSDERERLEAACLPGMRLLGRA
jgi:putative sulfotransferase